MKYSGKYRFFDVSGIRTYSLSARANKVRYGDLVWPDDALGMAPKTDPAAGRQISSIAGAIVEARRRNRAVVCFTGAHLVKNGLGPLLADLVERGFITLVAGNGATAIHDFELAQTGETSENVPDALPAGTFGMAWEFAWYNTAISVGNAKNLGCGESLGRAVCDPRFRALVERACPAKPRGGKLTFAHPEASVLARAYRCGIPFTVHVGIGTDVVDQHGSFDGEAKGGTSGRDFLIYCAEVTRLSGGVALNIGSAITGPEVLLKAVSMAANTGHRASGLTTADFDLRPFMAGRMDGEDKYGYYFRDQKSVATRIPEAFGGKGYYVRGNQVQTFPALFKALRRLAPGI